MSHLHFLGQEAEEYNTLWSGGGIITFIIAIAFGLYQLLLRLDLTLESAFGLLWKHVVQLMPEQLVHILRSRLNNVLPKRGSGTGQGFNSKQPQINGTLQGALGNGKLDEEESTLASSAGPRGLGNWDNSCFQNSVLQALSSLSAVQTFLGGFPAPYSGADDSTLLSLRTLTKALNSRPASGKHMWTPAQLKSMNSWQQQDAQEYYSKLMDQLEKDVTALSVKNAEARDPGLADLNLSATPASEKDDQDSDDSAISMTDRKHGRRRPSPPTNPLDGLLAQRVGCLRCGYSEGLSLTPFNCMTLPLGKGPSYDVRDCLDSYMELELIEGVNCAKCTLLNVSKQLERLISTLPPPPTSTDSAPSASPYHARLAAISNALSTSSFSDETLLQACKIPSTIRTSSTKSRQAVLMRPPKCLVLHVNRSIFDEYSGMLAKNHASVTFPMVLDLSPWCGGSINTEASESDDKIAEWEMNPAKSMLSPFISPPPSSACDYQYTLQAVITHYGRHENGHYICYRKTPGSDQWWRISDEDVWKVSEAEVEAQGGVFMLFYERGETRDKTKSDGEPTSSAQKDVRE